MNDYEWRLSVKYSPDQPRVPAGSSEGGQFASSGGVPASGAAPDYSGPVTFGRSKVTRSRFGSTRGEQLTREIEVQRQHSSGLSATILYIRQRQKGTPFRLYGLGGSQVGSEHSSLRNAKREAAQIAELVESEDQLP